MRLITEDNDNKTYLIYLTKAELDQIEGLATFYEFRNKIGDIPDEDRKFLCDLHLLCGAICAHLYYKGGDE